MTITYDLDTNIGKIRLLIDDKAGSQFSDEELESFLEDEDDEVLGAAALALESWASSLSESVVEEKIGDYSYKKGTRTGGPADTKMALAAKYRERLETKPQWDYAEWDMTDYGSSEL